MADRPLNLAEDLTPIERCLLAAAAAGRVLDLRSGPGVGGGPRRQAERTVRSQVVAAAVTGRVDGLPLRAVRLRGAVLTGPLNLGGETLLCPLELYECEVPGRIFLARSRGTCVSLRGSHLRRGLSARYLRLSQDLNLSDGFSCLGRVDLRSVHLKGHLNAAGAHLFPPRGSALDLAGARLDRGLHLTGAQVQGRVDLNGCVVGGVGVRADRLRLEATQTPRPALRADRMVTVGGLHLHGAHITGEVVVTDAHVEGHFDLRGSQLVPALPDEDDARPALLGDRLSVSGDALLSDALIQGQVRLPGADIGGALALDRLDLSGPQDYLLLLCGLQVGGAAFVHLARPVEGIDLTQARVGAWLDDPRTWPVRVRLDGFVYGELGSLALPVRSRLRWLERDTGGYVPQPYLQLAGHLRRLGNVDGARTVSIAMQRHHRAQRNERYAVSSRAWSALLRWTIGYGHHPARVLGPFSVLLVAGAVAQRWAYGHGLITSELSPGARSPYDPVRYTLDLLLPVANLHQRDGWAPQGVDSWITLTLSMSGWLLALILVSGLTGVFRKDGP